MNLRSSPNRAFTLIELLVVITIIAVLAGLLLPVTGKVMENARKASAKSTESQIVNAVNQYFAEYGSYPVPLASSSASTPADFTYDDSKNHNGILFDVLRGLNSSSDSQTGTLNTRRVSYFEMKNTKSITVPKDGFIAALQGAPKTSTGTALIVGDLVDPWGNLYYIRLDSNYSNAIKNPYDSPRNFQSSDIAASDPSTVASDTSLLRTGVAAYSWGADGLAGTKGTISSPYYNGPQGDDVTSWQ